MQRRRRQVLVAQESNRLPFEPSTAVAAVAALAAVLAPAAVQGALVAPSTSRLSRVWQRDLAVQIARSAACNRRGRRT